MSNSRVWVCCDEEIIDLISESDWVVVKGKTILSVSHKTLPRQTFEYPLDKVSLIESSSPMSITNTFD